MKKIPTTNDVLVLRTDFSDEKTWKSICKSIKTPEPENGFLPNVEFHSDKKYEGLKTNQLLSLLPDDYEHPILFIVDDQSMSNREHSILCIDLIDEPGKHFRVIPSEVWGVENNLSEANMDFIDFADSVDKDGVFRGFN
jgi:hypothetical protein